MEFQQPNIFILSSSKMSKRAFPKEEKQKEKVEEGNLLCSNFCQFLFLKKLDTQTLIRISSNIIMIIFFLAFSCLIYMSQYR